MRSDCMMQKNFYDFVAHHFASLADKDFDMPLPEIIFCLK